MVDKEIIENFISLGKDLILLREDKRPASSKWKGIKFDKGEILAHKGMLGWSLDEEALIIDVDWKNGGFESFAKLCEDNEEVAKLEKTVTTAGGGFHIYLKWKRPVDFEIRKTLPNIYPGIDFLRKTGYVVIPGSFRQGHGEYKWVNEAKGFYQQECPEFIINLLKVPKRIDVEKAEGGIPEKRKYPKETAEEVATLLPFLPIADNYHIWFEVGACFWSWDSSEKGMGFAYWCEWSKNCPEKYNDKSQYEQWAKFQDKGLHINTLYKMAKEKGWKRVKKEYSRQEQEEGEEGEQEEEEEQEEEQEVSEAVDLLAPAPKKKKELTFKRKWWEKYIYVYHTNKYYDIEKHFAYTVSGFNKAEKKWFRGTKIKPDDFTDRADLMKSVEYDGYKPTEKKKIYVETIGKTSYRYLNTFNPDTLTKKADKYSKEGNEAINRLKQHIRYVFTNDRDVKIFTSWLAHNVQHFGEKINWCPLIQSVEGIGKSFFGKVLRAVLGYVNIGVVVADDVMSNFSSWATGYGVVIFEELRVAGKNRHCVANKLKPYQTDQYVSVTPKGVDPYRVFNCTNYIAFTNFKNALPITETDRRYYVVFHPAKKKPEYIMGEHKKEYFKHLHKTLEYASEITKWLSEYKIDYDVFDAKGEAPETEDKKRMVESEQMLITGFNEIKGILKEGDHLYNEEFFSSVALFARLKDEYPELFLTSSDKNRLLLRLGYEQGDRITLGGVKTHLWTKDLERIKNRKPREIEADLNNYYEDVILKKIDEEQRAAIEKENRRKEEQKTKEKKAWERLPEYLEGYTDNTMEELTPSQEVKTDVDVKDTEHQAFLKDLQKEQNEDPFSQEE